MIPLAEVLCDDEFLFVPFFFIHISGFGAEIHDFELFFPLLVTAHKPSLFSLWDIFSNSSSPHLLRSYGMIFLKHNRIGTAG